ncbi:hypothetical protein ACJRO7_004295 [Eucalyptus globulus]|uniref:tRNA (guanine(26)-N(2))-dimethyltransferase n=1 Tax=Eucalyptus globulus TaxID=34317 RepID=A0ABD3IZB8_EUCGL
MEVEGHNKMSPLMELPFHGTDEVEFATIGATNKVRVMYVRSSLARAKTFKTYIKSEMIAYKGSICLDVATRWNSTYMILDTAIKFKKAFKRKEDEDLFFLREIDNDPPEDEDWENAIILFKFLRRFYDTTKMMSVWSKDVLGPAFFVSVDNSSRLASLSPSQPKPNNLKSIKSPSFGLVQRSPAKSKAREFEAQAQCLQQARPKLDFGPYALSGKPSTTINMEIEHLVEYHCINKPYGKYKQLSASALKNTHFKLSYVYQCTGCDSFHLQQIGRTVSKNNSMRYIPGFGPVVPQECTDCGKKFNMGGPIWSAPIHDHEWVTSILADLKSMKDRYPAYDRISAVLTTISEDMVFAGTARYSLFLSLHNLCTTLKCTSPSAVIFRSAVINAGYRISGTHVNPLGLKTDAPMDVIWDIMRCWVKSHRVKEQPSDQPGSVILAKEPAFQANFARAVASLSKAQAKKVARFLPNPERHWGPRLRAGRQITSKHISLLGPEAVNGSLKHDDHDDDEEAQGEAKRRKTEDRTLVS